ncbi:MAG: efflux RND transporter periplasmic adaptor subunit [Gammaproteobacteria bacterium]|nr:efflux RND transporter periplasmic adaptor subunit [Gammaproteobacteria bacterium]
MKKFIYLQLLVISMFVTTIVPFSLVGAATYDATVRFANRVTLSMPVSGIIKSVYVAAGQHIQAEQILIALDQTPFEAAVAQANAEVTIRATKKTQAMRDYQQAQELYDRTVLSNVELENAKLKADRATAAYSAAQASLTIAKFNLAHSKVIAPFDGLVLQLYAKENENVNNALESQPLVVFAAKDQYTAKMLAPLSALALLAIGQKGKVTIGNKQFTGTVISTALEPVESIYGNKEFDDKEARYEVNVEFKTDNIVLRAGQSARVEFP